jgi:hypothetical protein
MSWSNSANNKWGRRSTRDRGKVVWIDNSGAKPAPFAQAMPRYGETKPIPDEFEPHLYVGALWMASVPMNPDTRGAGQFPPLVPYYWPADQAIVKVKSLMIYAGIVRIEERESNGRIVSVPRHTFIAAAGRYIVTDFSTVSPVT